jgi:transposase-like protein
MHLEKRMAKTRQQIADEYGIDRKTLYRWLKKAGIQLNG